MIYEKPGGGKRGLPRHANREVAVALVLFACAAAMAVSYGLGAYCDGSTRTGWPCLPRHAARQADGTTTAVADDGAPGSGASGLVPPVAVATGSMGFGFPSSGQPTIVLDTPTAEQIAPATSTVPPTPSIPTARPLATAAVASATPTFVVITMPPRTTSTATAPPSASVTGPTPTPGTITPDATGSATATPTASATPTDGAYP